MLCVKPVLFLFLIIPKDQVVADTTTKGDYRTLVVASDQSFRPRKHDQPVNPIDTSRRIQLSPGIMIEKGRMNFRRASVKEIMQMITNRYHVPIVYLGKIPKDIFSGSMNFNIKLEFLLRLLGDNGINNSYDGKKVVVGE